MASVSFVEKWEAVRTKGEKRYVLLCLLVIGIAAPSATIGVMRLGGTRLQPGVMAFLFIYCMLAGIGAGLVGWHVNEKRYRNLLVRKSGDRLMPEEKQTIAGFDKSLVLAALSFLCALLALAVSHVLLSLHPTE